MMKRYKMFSEKGVKDLAGYNALSETDEDVKKLPTVKVLQAEYTELLTKKKAAYEDYKRLRKENQELQAVKSNVDTLLRIEEEPQEKKQEQHR